MNPPGRTAGIGGAEGAAEAGATESGAAEAGVIPGLTSGVAEACFIPRTTAGVAEACAIPGTTSGVVEARRFLESLPLCVFLSPFFLVVCFLTRIILTELFFVGFNLTGSLFFFLLFLQVFFKKPCAES